MELSLNLFQTMALACGVFYLGAFLKSKVPVFQKYCIASPVIGGIIFAILNLVLHQTGVLNLTIDTSLQTVFMNAFFTSVGFGAGFTMIKQGGKKLLVFLVMIAALGILQTGVAAGLCNVFGLDSLLGIAMGTMSLTGGHGTSAAFAPLLEERGVVGATTIAVASATYGLVAGNVIGNPLAVSHIRKLGLKSTDEAGEGVKIETGVDESVTLDSSRGTLGVALLFVALGIGTLISLVFDHFHITFASYVGAMIVGIIIRNVCDARGAELPLKDIATTGDICLNFFLSLAMMGLQLYQLIDLALPMIVILLVNTVVTGLFVYFVEFRVMGGDYDAAVLSSGHTGFGLGATPNAMANMDALTSEFGPSEKAYLIVPICGGFFTDIINAFLITFFMNVL